jgi:hypothetical protein
VVKVNLYRAITATYRLFTPYSYALASKIDWKDLERLAGDADYDEEFMDILENILANSPLTEKELGQLWNIYVIWKRAQREAGVDLWESEGDLDARLALRIIFDENTSEKMWKKMGHEVFWYHPEVRNTFFSELPGKNPSSKLLLILLPLIAEGASDGISQDNYESLQECRYFKESRFKTSGLFVDPDAE